MTFPNVCDGATVRNHITAEFPLLAQNVGHQTLVGAARFGVGAIVGTHDGIGAALDNRRAKRGQIGFLQISLDRDRIKRMTLRFGAAVYGVVLWRGYYLEVFRIVTLKTFDKFDAQARGE